jgi:hypothetical protein
MENIWKDNIWPKVNMFLLLMDNNFILTWDNLRKCGFIGPFVFPIFLQNEESMDQRSQVMHTSNRQHENIIYTLDRWRL